MATEKPRKRRVSAEISEYMAAISGRGAGGRARAEKLSSQQRKEIAQKAASARWAKKPESASA